jgi:uncharacterized protein (TIRG00374 family)
LIVIAEETKDSAAPPSSRKLFIAIQLVVTAVLLGVGFWYITARVTLQAISDALANVHSGYILLATAVMVITIALKVWRWQFLFAPADPDSGNPALTPDLRFPPSRRVPTYRSLFWATSLGQYVNLLIPFLRLGEIARIYALRQQEGISGMRTVGTLVVEKAIDLIFFALTVIVLLPLVVLPDFYQPGLLLVIVPALLLIFLFFLAYRPHIFVQLSHRLIRHLPERWQERFARSLIAGLEGIAALRNSRATAALLLLSLIIAILSALLPYILFPAFSIPLGLVEGALMHVVVSVASLPPSTPAKIGVFNGVAALLLLQLGVQDEAVVISYAIVFHLVVIVPQIVLGTVAAWQTDWNWGSHLRSSHLRK